MGICPRCGKEEVAVCPECGGQVDVYSRIVGYLRPVALWNPGKQQEFLERKEYTRWNGDHIQEYDTDYTDKKHE